MLPKHGLGERVFVCLTIGHNPLPAEVVPEQIKLTLAPYPLGMFLGGFEFDPIAVFDFQVNSPW